MGPKALKCGKCGHEHTYPPETAAGHARVIVLCDGCKSRIDIIPGKWWGYKWPKIVTKGVD